MGLAHIGDKNWAEAIDAFKGLIDLLVSDRTPMPRTHPSNWARLQSTDRRTGPASAEVLHAFCKDRTCLRRSPSKLLRVGGFRRNSILGDLDTAEKTFRSSCLSGKRSRMRSVSPPDFTWPSRSTTWRRSRHQRFQANRIALAEAQMDKDLDQKASLLLQAQRAYIENHQYGNRPGHPPPASRSARFTNSSTTPSCMPRFQAGASGRSAGSVPGGVTQEDPRAA